MTKKSQHVVPHSSGQWSVKKAGSSKATRVFTSRAEAVEFAKNLAKSNEAEIYIHKKDGTIQKKESFITEIIITKGKR